MAKDKLKIWHVPIDVKNLERSVEFYCDVIGLKMVGLDEYDDKKQAFVEISPGGFCVELYQRKGKYAKSPTRNPDHLAFEAVDLSTFRGRLIKLGLKVAKIADFGNGVKYLALMDPDGLPIEVFQGRKNYEASIRKR